MIDYQHIHKASFTTVDQVHRIWRGRLVPLVLVYNGLVPKGLLAPVISDGVKDHPLNHGNMNYWVLREWASHCLGREAIMAGVCPLGDRVNSVLALNPEAEHDVPSLFARPKFVDHGRVTVRGEDMSWTAFQDRISIALPAHWEGYFLTYDENGLSSFANGEFSLSFVPSAYKYFASRAIFSGSGGDYGRYGRFARVQVPMVPLNLQREMGEVVYRKSAFSGDQTIFGLLAKNGYGYSYDSVEHVIYYSNSVAVCDGYPPVASAMGWQRVPLKHLPGNWTSQLDKGYLAVGHT
jgi:hypothetical protein